MEGWDMQPEMTLRDHFAAAALTGLIASREWPIDSEEAAHYCYRVAEAMLRERCLAGGDCPVPDNAPIHDAAPAAKASLPTADHAVCRGRESGCGTGDTDHGAAPAARASDGRPRTDKADLPTRAGTGDTPTVGDIATCDTLATQTTPGECSTPSEGTSEPVAWWVRGCEYETGCEYEFVALLKEQAELAATQGGKAVPLYRSPTLTDAEREAIGNILHHIATRADHLQREAYDLRGLLERL